MRDILADANLPTPLHDAVWRELDPSPSGGFATRARETVLWVGQPDAARVTRAALPIVFFGIPWTLFSVFWMAMAAQASFWFALFGTPFVLVGFGMLTAPFFAGKKARETVYVMTDKRILLVAASPKASEVKNYVPRSESDIERMEKKDGTGDLTFFRREGRDSDGDRTVEKVSLTGIHDVRAVEMLLRDVFFAPRPLSGNEQAARLPVYAAPSAAPWYTAHRG